MLGPTKPKKQRNCTERGVPFMIDVIQLFTMRARTNIIWYFSLLIILSSTPRERKTETPRIPSPCFEWREICHRRRALLGACHRLAFLLETKRSTIACKAATTEAGDRPGNGGIFLRGLSLTANASTGRNGCRSTTTPLATPRILTKAGGDASMDLIAGLYKLASVDNNE